MRQLVILRGAPGSGKSTFVKNQGLGGFAVSPDTIRLMTSGVVMSDEGRLMISQKNDTKIWRQVEEILDVKMARGEFVILDTTSQRARDFNMPLKLVRKYRYEVLCVDFSDVPQEVAIEGNQQRELYKRVPKYVITRAYDYFKESPLPKGLKAVSHSIYRQKSLLEDLDVKSVDLNAYKKIHHIGDLQGCYDPIKGYLKRGFQEDEFYIFIGDFLDRGIQNAEVIRWVVDEVMDRSNVVMLWGNHETHIHRFATNQHAVSKEFELNTLPQIEQVNFTQSEANRLCSKLKDCFIYTFNEKNYFVTHGGVAKLPDYPILIPSSQYWKGTGTYEHPVDQEFSKNMEGTNWIQIHGHRNIKELPVQAAVKSYNLEAKVEFGGHLRILVLHQGKEAECIEIKNTVHRKAAPIESNEYGKIDQEALDKLINHPCVNVNTFKSHPHIRSYQFSRTAFTKGIWDTVNITARGLFIDERRTIVARAYDKFFNLGERPETQMHYLETNLKFPITLYVKENGFLGILGYDELKDSLFFASKSTPESDFAGWFKEIVTAQLGEYRFDYLKRLLRERNLGMVFEVNDPNRDPHLIEYAEPHVVLLDIMHRTAQFRQLDYTDMQKIAKSYGLAYKQKAMSFTHWNGFTGWYRAMETQGLNYKINGKHIEGFVVEDSNRAMFKIKLPYYSFWKAMRGIKERILTIREKGGDLNRDISSPETHDFYRWANQQPDEILKQDIITLRRGYILSAERTSS